MTGALGILAAVVVTWWALYDYGRLVREIAADIRE